MTIAERESRASVEINTRFLEYELVRDFKIVETSRSIYVIYKDKKIMFDTIGFPEFKQLNLTLFMTTYRPHGFRFSSNKVHSESQWGYIRFSAPSDESAALTNKKRFVYYSFILTDEYLLNVTVKHSGKCRRVPDGNNVYYVSNDSDNVGVDDSLLAELDVFGIDFSTDLSICVNN